MNGEEIDNELNQWFSTYGAITAERILGRYNVNLAQTDLVAAIKSPFSFYHRLIQVPLKSVLNGIILQQANDYHVYVQKLYIDYLLSGENSKGEEAQGAATREIIENERQQLVALGEQFQKVQGDQDYLIANSQRILIQMTQRFNAELEKALSSLNKLLKAAGHKVKKSQIRQAINHALIYCNVIEIRTNGSLFVDKMNEVLKVSLKEDLKGKMLTSLSELLQMDIDFDDQIIDYVQQTDEINRSANSYRSQFFDTIIRVIDLMKSLPEYKIDPEQDAINREPLYFDKSIGSL